jgi:hypothetical protein
MIWEQWCFGVAAAAFPTAACVHASKMARLEWRAASGQLQVEREALLMSPFPVPMPVGCEQGNQGGLQAVWLEVD